MFIDLARLYQTAGNLHTVQLLPAIQLSRWLDEAWYNSASPGRGFLTTNAFGATLEQVRRDLGHPQPVAPAGQPIVPSGLNPPAVVPPPGPYTDGVGPSVLLGRKNVVWQHLIYAYVVESTGAIDIMAEVARRLVAGESLGVLSPASIVWLRNTEELFFRDPPLFSVSGVRSDLRPSASVNRRNAYWRLFGMDLPHQVPAGWPNAQAADAWKRHSAPGVNTDFQEKLTELLRQVWIGIINAGNTIGPNPTDPGYVALLCRAIGDMLRDRRQNGLLAREEFVYVTFLSWFHLTLMDGGGPSPNAPVVRDVKAEGTAPEQRLNNLALKVGMKPAPRSRELFQLAEPMSWLLRSIELGAFDTSAQAQLLYDGTSPQFVTQMRLIVNNWQSATGQRIKDQVAVTATGTLQPLRVPTPAGSRMGQTPSGNGSGSGG